MIARHIPALLVLLLLTAVSLPAADALRPAEANEVLSAATEDFRTERYDRAFQRFQDLYLNGYGTAAVLTNAGTAAHNTGRTGEAVLFYHRALTRDPGFQPARTSLRAVQPITNTTDEETLAGWVAERFAATPGWLWLVLFELAFVFLIFAILRVARSTPGTDARSSRASQLATAGIVTVLSFGLLAGHSASRAAGPDAVLLESAVSRSGPGEKYFQQRELPAGTVIYVRETPEEGWVRYRLADGQTGYIRTAAVEPI